MSCASNIEARGPESVLIGYVSRARYLNLGWLLQPIKGTRTRAAASAVREFRYFSKNEYEMGYFSRNRYVSGV